MLLVLLAALASTAPRPVSVVRVPHGGIQPQAVVDGRGTLHLLYFLGDPKGGDLFYVKSSDSGATWSAPLRVNRERGAATALGTIRGGQLAIGGHGRVHVAWNGSSAVQSKGAPMLYSRLNDVGTAFEAERNLMTRTFGLDGGGAIAADTQGAVYVAWHGKTPGAPAGEAGRQVWIAISRDGGAHFAAEQPAWKESTGACACCGMAMFADAEGAVRLLYRSAVEGTHRDVYLLTSLDHGRGFTGRKVHSWEINACPMSSMAFSGRMGEVKGAWETGGQVYFEDFTRAGAAPVSAPGNGKGRKHPRIAIGPHGNTLMVWTEGTGWQKGGALACQIFDAAGKPAGERRTLPGLPAWSFAAAAVTPAGFVVIY